MEQEKQDATMFQSANRRDDLKDFRFATLAMFGWHVWRIEFASRDTRKKKKKDSIRIAHLWNGVRENKKKIESFRNKCSIFFFYY